MTGVIGPTGQQADVVAGDWIADRLLVAPLGRGGEGEVWHARRPDDSDCALKLIRPEVLPAPREVRRRGEWLVRIDHPGLVRVSRGGRFTAGRLAGWGFVEMDLVAGEALVGATPLPDALSRLAVIADGLDRLHAGAWSDGVPLIHRDVKPGNLIQTSSGLVLVDPSTMRGLDTVDLTRIGTPAYLAPEVVTGRFGPLADVYSLGATAAALLTGARGRTLSAVVADPVGHGLPPGVCAALAPDPADRPGTCAAVLTATEAAPDRRASRRRARASGWPLALFTLLVGVPIAAWAAHVAGVAGIETHHVTGAVAAAVIVHLVVHVGTGRAAAGLLAPPWAWGALVAADHDGTDQDRRWHAAVTAGTIVAAGTVAVLVAPLASAEQRPIIAAVALAAAVLLCAIAGGVAHAVTRRWRWCGRAVLLPLWLLGALPRALARR